MNWIRTLTPVQRRALFAAMLGWMFDAMDFLIYVLAIGRIKTYFGFNDATAGLLGTFTLLSAAAGGLAFGVIADRIGRVRALNITIAIFSICSVGAATSQSVVQLAIWRTLLGLGMGGEWASGGVLVAETLPPEVRNKATSLMQSTWALGAILAAGPSPPASPDSFSTYCRSATTRGGGCSRRADFRRFSSSGCGAASRSPTCGGRVEMPVRPAFIHTPCSSGAPSATARCSHACSRDASSSHTGDSSSGCRTCSPRRSRGAERE
jgi:hypothetical protein